MNICCGLKRLIFRTKTCRGNEDNVIQSTNFAVIKGYNRFKLLMTILISLQVLGGLLKKGILVSRILSSCSII